MKLLYRCCAGLDIHRDTVSACIRRQVTGESETVIEEQVFGTFTQELKRLSSWLKKYHVKQVAMESTGVYWIPLWNVLEGKFTLTLVNPATVHALQGNKTDRIDARRIAEYLQHGLLRGSFIPPKPIRELRELTRMRVHVQQERNRVINRIARLLETVNIKLASVASNIVGSSGLEMLRLLARGECHPESLAECACGKLRGKIPALIQALEGRPDEHFRWKLSELLRKLEGLEAERARIDLRLEILAAPYQDVLRRLDTIPGVDRTAALVLLAEFGSDMTQFPTAAHLASWAGLCPGNAESAGKRFSGRTRKGDRYIRRMLVQCAWATLRRTDCFLTALFFRIAQRRGMKKAALAVAHRMLVIAWHILAEAGAEYVERGGSYFDRRRPERTARALTMRLQASGYQVTLTSTASMAPATAPPNSRTRPRSQRATARQPTLPPLDPSVCRRCARWNLPHCICLVKRKPRNPPAVSPTPPIT
jgi:transposase